jgi:hypothetical protein
MGSTTERSGGCGLGLRKRARFEARASRSTRCSAKVSSFIGGEGGFE